MKPSSTIAHYPSVKHETVSVIIPCRNEARYIGPCLDSVLANGYPVDRLEIFVVDGMSDDTTRDIVAAYAQRHPVVRLLDNPRRTAPAALNIGIRHATGEMILRLDAHTTYGDNYIARSVEALHRYQAANAGGIIKTMPGRNTVMANAIAYAISHPFGVGLSHFRLAKNRVRYVDTVPFGCFRRALFDTIGLFDETLPRNEDIDMNIRIRQSGAKIILHPEIVSFYYARGTLKEFWRHNFDNGYLVTAPLAMRKMRHSIRHLVPLGALMVLLGGMAGAFIHPWGVWFLAAPCALYLLCDLYFSFKAVLHRRNPVYFFIMPWIFPILHIGYSLGSLCGLLRPLRGARA